MGVTLSAWSAASTPRLSHTASGLFPSTEQMAAVISFAAATTAWVSGEAGLVRSPAIWSCETPARTAGEKPAPFRT